MRNRRKRKGSDDDGDSPVQDIDTPEVVKQLLFLIVMRSLLLPTAESAQSCFPTLTALVWGVGKRLTPDLLR